MSVYEPPYLSGEPDTAPLIKQAVPPHDAIGVVEFAQAFPSDGHLTPIRK
jgi:hypothetical protein